MSYLVDLAAVDPKPIWAGVRARIVQGERVTMAVVEIEPGGVVPEHHHANEQVGMVVQGRVTFQVGEEARQLEVGGTWRIPRGTPHQVVAGEQGAVVVDIFSPPRADWEPIAAETGHRPLWPS